jgi:hypothetical protein
MEDTLIAFGGGVKTLEGGKIAGYLVRFTDPASPDLAGEYFTKNTDFDCEFPFKSTIYYNHGLDKNLKRRKLGKVEMKMDDVGIWVEGQLEERDEYEKAIAQMAIAGKLGWSSGTASHLTERKSVNGATEITMWPLGLDASVTPTPCEPRNAVVSIKSYQASLAESTKYFEGIEKYMTINALYCANSELWYNAICGIICDDEMTGDQKAAEVGAAIDQYKTIVTGAITRMLAGATSEEAGEYKAQIQSRWVDPALESLSDPLTGITLKKHLQATLSAFRNAFRRVTEVKTKRLAENKDSVSVDNREPLSEIAKEAQILSQSITELLTIKSEPEQVDWKEVNELRAQSLRINGRVKGLNNV